MTIPYYMEIIWNNGSLDPGTYQYIQFSRKTGRRQKLDEAEPRAGSFWDAGFCIQVVPWKYLSNSKSPSYVSLLKNYPPWN